MFTFKNCFVIYLVFFVIYYSMSGIAVDLPTLLAQDIGQVDYRTVLDDDFHLFSFILISGVALLKFKITMLRNLWKVVSIYSIIRGVFFY